MKRVVLKGGPYDGRTRVIADVKGWIPFIDEHGECDESVFLDPVIPGQTEVHAGPWDGAYVRQDAETMLWEEGMANE